MNILILDPRQGKGISKNKVTEYQLYGFAKCLRELGVNIKVGVSESSYEFFDFESFDISNNENLKRVNDFDAVILSLYNGNYYAGMENIHETLTIRFLAEFKKEIYYFFTDAYMTFKDFSETVSKKKNWSCSNDNPDLYKVNDLNILIHSFNINVSKRACLLNKANIKRIVNFPVQLSSFYLDDIVYEDYDKIEKKYDVGYSMGSFSGYKYIKRALRINEFLFDTSLNAALSGKVKLKDFDSAGIEYKNPPVFLGKVKFNELASRNKEFLSTVIISDNKFNNHFYVLRLFEAFLTDQIVFIDEKYDKNHIIFNDSFRYVSSKKDLQDRIIELKANTSLKRELINEQREFMIDGKYSKRAFRESCKAFIKYMEANNEKIC